MLLPGGRTLSAPATVQRLLSPHPRVGTPLKRVFVLLLKEEAEQPLSGKQDSILGRTLDLELYAQDLWK